MLKQSVTLSNVALQLQEMQRFMVNFQSKTAVHQGDNAVGSSKEIILLQNYNKVVLALMK